MLISIEDLPERSTGIARLAMEGALLAGKARVEYRDLPSRSILNRCTSDRVPFSWTINPYRGCEIGCKYCYARYTHEFMGFNDGQDFERIVYAKTEAAELLKRDLRRHKSGAIAIGTSTDPYQPAERRFQITRGLLEVFANRAGHTLWITTKSHLIQRDTDLLTRIAERNALRVTMTITTVDESLARKIEPRAPRPQLRLDAVRAFSDAGVSTSIFASPVMPYINDSKEQIDALAQAAKAHGAQSIGANPIFLMPSAKQTFLPFLEDNFPHLARKYETHFDREAYLRGKYAARLKTTIEEVQEKYGLQRRQQDVAPPPTQQLSLFG